MKAKGGSLSFGAAQAIDAYMTGREDDAMWQWAWRNPELANRGLRRAMKSAARKANRKAEKGKS